MSEVENQKLEEIESNQSFSIFELFYYWLIITQQIISLFREIRSDRWPLVVPPVLCKTRGIVDAPRGLDHALQYSTPLHSTPSLQSLPPPRRCNRLFSIHSTLSSSDPRTFVFTSLCVYVLSSFPQITVTSITNTSPIYCFGGRYWSALHIIRDSCLKNGRGTTSPGTQDAHREGNLQVNQ